ncbi:IS110 family transposase, partial [Nocardia sp. NPDC059239]
MSIERTSVGLDVHALSVVACGIDNETGQLSRQRLCPDPGQILAWLAGLAGPVKVAYEAGPTGFGLYRALSAAGIECVVAAPSKLQRPAGDRVKTQCREVWLLESLSSCVGEVEVTGREVQVQRR